MSVEKGHIHVHEAHAVSLVNEKTMYGTVTMTTMVPKDMDEAIIRVRLGVDGSTRIF